MGVAKIETQKTMAPIISVQISHLANACHDDPFQSINCAFETYNAIANDFSTPQISAAGVYCSSSMSPHAHSSCGFDMIEESMLFDNIIKAIDLLVQKIVSILRHVLNLHRDQCQLKIKFWRNVSCLYGSPAPVYAYSTLSPPGETVLLDKTMMI